VTEFCLPSNQVNPVTEYADVARGINSGDTALFIEGTAKALIINTKGYEHRSVDRPQIEQSVRGSQVSFGEALRTNTGLIRTMVQSSDLITEIIPIGKRVSSNCAVMYLKSIANPDLINEVKRRISNFSTDYVSTNGQLEQFIEDHPSIPFPQSLSTERPDRVAPHLLEGRVAVLLEGASFVHVLPVGLFGFFHSVEDISLGSKVASFMRILRYLGAFIAVVLPSGYLSINYFHPEALPTEMALAVAGAREKVPFPAFFEMLIMEFSFELIREAGLRVPGMLGSTIGIVGAIIVGQAAVSANIVSPIMVVIIAMTGVASFCIPDYRLAFAFRIVRIILLLLAMTMGFVGVAYGLLLLVVLLCNMKSFGVPYLAPIAPRTIAGLDIVIRGPVFRQERRPDELNPQDVVRQPPISRMWTKHSPANKKDTP
jgi:spore germination protein KA